MRKFSSALIIIALLSQVKAQIWQPDMRITASDSNSYFSYPCQWAIAADYRGWVHIVWYDHFDEPLNSMNIYYIRSTDNGVSFGPITLLADYGNFAGCPAIVTDNFGRLHVVFYRVQSNGIDVDIIYKQSTDGGSTWGIDKILGVAHGDFGMPLSLATNLRDGVFVIYSDWTGPYFDSYDCWFIRSTDGGSTWATPVKLTNSALVDVVGSIAADTLNRLHIVYVDHRTGVRQLYYRRSTNMGQSFEPEVSLTTRYSNKFFTSVYTDRGDNVHVVWEDSSSNTNNWEIYYLHSTNGGVSWSQEIRLTSDMGKSTEPNLTVDCANRVYVVWADNRNDPQFDIYFKESKDGGFTWSHDTCLVPDYVGHTPEHPIAYPNIISSPLDTSLHLAWSDKRDGNFEIYYKRRLSAGEIWEKNNKMPPIMRLQAFPNPFTSHATICFDIMQNSENQGYGNTIKPLTLSIKIYDAGGRLIRQFNKLSSNPLHGAIEWFGDDDFGSKLPAGVYFVKLDNDSNSVAQKLILLKQ
jgi:hypothetical protein